MTTPPPPAPEEPDGTVPPDGDMEVVDEDSEVIDHAELLQPPADDGLHSWLGVPVLLIWGATFMAAIIWFSSDPGAEHNTERYGVYTLIVGLAAVGQSVAAATKVPVFLRAFGLAWLGLTVSAVLWVIRLFMNDAPSPLGEDAVNLTMSGVLFLGYLVVTGACAAIHMAAARHHAALQRGEFVEDAYTGDQDE